MRRKRSQAGFTLVELMVSLVLFSFAIAGVLAIAVSMAQGYREQRQIVETETAARGALDFISDAVRMASPAVSTAVVKSNAGASLVIDASQITAVEDTMGPSGACPQGSVRVSNNTGLNGSDVLEVVFASGPVVTTMTSVWDKNAPSIDVIDATSLAEGDTLLITDGIDGRLVRVEDITGNTIDLVTPTCTVTDPSVNPYPAGSLVLRVLRARFFLFNNTTDGISTALYMDPDADGELDPEPLADWIEDFQVAVGIDEDQNNSIDANEWAYSGVSGTVAPFTVARKLHAVRISLVARPATSLVATTASYAKPTIEDHTPSGPLDTLRRRVLSTTVEIRNLGDSP